MAHFGYEDNFYAQYFEALGFKRKYFTKRRYFYRERDNDEVNRDGSHHSLRRDDSQNREIYEKKIEKMRNFGALAAHSRVFLNFTWQVLRENTPQNIKDKKRGMFWFLRNLKN